MSTPRSKSRFGNDDEDPLAGTYVTAADDKGGQVATVATRPKRTLKGKKTGPVRRGHLRVQPITLRRGPKDAPAPPAVPPTPPPQDAAATQAKTPVPKATAATITGKPARSRVHYSLRDDCIEFAETEFREGRRADGSRWPSASQYVESLILIAMERKKKK